MKVLFVCSGNYKYGIIPPIIVQSDSLQEIGVMVSYFPIAGKGIFNYLKNVKPLSRRLKSENYDLVHAHYALSGLVVLLTGIRIPKVLSLMGTDLTGDYLSSRFIRLSSFPVMLISRLIQPFFNIIIVKSRNLSRSVYWKKKLRIIPNGINLQAFKPGIKFDSGPMDAVPGKKYVLFLGNPDNPHKNFKLLEKAITILNDERIVLVNPYPVRHSEIPLYLNQCDLLVLTSFREGSPNVVKEAMACNCPIISTPVGDVHEIIGDTYNCYISSFNPSDLASKILKVLESGRRTNGREKIKDLDSRLVANRIKALYSQLLKY